PINLRRNRQYSARLTRVTGCNHFETHWRLPQLASRHIHDHDRLAFARHLVAVLSVRIKLRLVEREMDQGSSELSFAGIVRSPTSVRHGLRSHHPTGRCQCHDAEESAAGNTHLD